MSRGGDTIAVGALGAEELDPEEFIVRLDRTSRS